MTANRYANSHSGDSQGRGKSESDKTIRRLTSRKDSNRIGDDNERTRRRSKSRLEHRRKQVQFDAEGCQSVEACWSNLNDAIGVEQQLKAAFRSARYRMATWRMDDLECAELNDEIDALNRAISQQAKVRQRALRALARARRRERV